ncbi:MAG: hypothetical protein WBP59_10305 [Ilumatobacteraceae bacterium]
MNVTIRTLTEPRELQEMVDLLQTVWGTPAPIVNFELLTAIAHSGGYVAAAFTPDASDAPPTPGTPDPTEILSRDVAQRNDGSEFRGGGAGAGAGSGAGSGAGGVMIGASLGLLATHGGRPALHSHVTGLVPTQRGTGLGRALKLHQRAWALEHGIDRITWTFDPLVRRNAWFNIGVLGAGVDAYLPSFYGTMTDAINAGDESDRLHVVWDLSRPVPERPNDGSGVDAARFVPTPDDIVALRGSDPDAVARWRRVTRAALTDELASGRTIVGFTRDGNYVIGSTT